MSVIVSGKREYLPDELPRYPHGQGNLTLNGVKFNDREPYDPVFRPPELGEVLFLPGLGVSGSKIWDRSGYGNHGTISGATWVKLVSGLWVLSFDGTNDYIDCGSKSALDCKAAITFTGWIKILDDVDGRVFLSLPGKLLMYTGVGRLVSISTHDAIGGRYTYTHTSTLATMQWYCVDFTYQTPETVCHLYVNGIEVTSYEAQQDTGGNPLSSLTANVLVGATGAGCINGYVGLSRIFNRALSATEIANIFNRERHLFGV